MTNCLKLDGLLKKVCDWLNVNSIVKPHHATIYPYLLKDKASGSTWYKYLRHQDKSCQKCYGYSNNRTDIPNQADIDQHPETINNRQVSSYWKADIMIGKSHKGTVVTLDERVSKLRVALPLNSRHKTGVSVAIGG